MYLTVNAQGICGIILSRRASTSVVSLLGRPPHFTLLVARLEAKSVHGVSVPR